MNQTNNIQGILEFLRHAEQLKNTLRTSYTSNGRQESTAEHTWRLCLMVMLLEKEYPNVDTLKLMKICIILKSSVRRVARGLIALRVKGIFRLFDPKAVHLYGEGKCSKKTLNIKQEALGVAFNCGF